MDSEARIGEKRRGFRHGRRLILTLPALAILGFVLSNLVLATPWVRGWIAGKIERKTGLETRLAGASWSPWGGVSLHRLELLQPTALRSTIRDPLARIATLKVSPVWRGWLFGRYDVRSVSLDTPRLIVPLELLSHLAQAQTPAAAVAPPPAGASAPATPPATPSAPASPAPTPAPAPPNRPPAAPAPPSRPTGWIHVKNGSLAIVSVRLEKPLLEISQTTGSLPIAGASAQSVLKIQSISLGGMQAFSALTPTLDWHAPVLSLKPVELQVGECKILYACKIASLSGLPLQIEAKIPEQPLTALRLPLDGQAQAESIRLNFGFRGLLLAPASWQADLVADSNAPSLRLAGHDAKFDRGSAVTVLRGGRISCVDARLISDELSLLGNATVLADGRVAGALRLVAPPANVVGMVKKAFPAMESPTLTPLATPQRSAFDLEALGNISQLSVRLGRHGPLMNLKP